jgi:transaldolase
MIESPVERLIETNPDMEVWWDSSPLIFDQWVDKLVHAAEPSRKAALKEQLLRLYNAEHPEQSVFRGCTTNPPLSWGAIQSDPKYWDEWVRKLCHENPKLDQERLALLTYKEIVRRGSDFYLPMFNATNGRFGWISAQLDPRLFAETDPMIAAADELHSIAANIMIKVPASMQGIEVLKILTSKGISTNTTTCFTLPQIMASADAVMEGLKIAEKNKVDMSRWRAVCTMMIGRLTENEALDLQADRKNIKLSWQEKHWFGIAVFKRAYRMLTEGGYASKLLSCSMRVGPLVAGKMEYWDIQKIAGGNIVYTCPPYVLEPFFELGDQLSFRAEMDEEVPQNIMDKMLTLPYCIQAYDPNGLALEQFNIHPATISTVQTFSKGFANLETFVGERMVTPVTV